MSDLIDRQDVIDLLQMNREEENKKSLSAECKHKSVIRSKHDAHVAFCDYLIECVKQLPTHPTPSNTLGALDCVDRQQAIDLVESFYKIDKSVLNIMVFNLKQLPSVQPRKGKWAGKGDSEGFGIFICDNCGKFAMMEYDFCPNCGCRMEEGDSDEVHN